MNEDSLRYVYNQAAVVYGNKYDQMGARAADIDHLFALSGKEHPFVYEIGCGTGRDAAYVVTKPCRYKGIDLSDEFIKMAKGRVPEGVFYQGDISTAAIPEGIDIAIAFAPLLHLSPAGLRSVLARLCVKMNPGGVLFLSLKRMSGPEYTDEVDEFGTRRFYYYTKDKVEAAINGLFAIEFYEEQARSEPWLSAIVRKL